MYEKNEFMLHWIECSQQLANALRKKDASKTKLLQALECSDLFNEERHLKVKAD